MQIVQYLLGDGDVLCHAQNLPVSSLQHPISPFAKNLLFNVGNVVVFGVAQPFGSGFLEDR